MGKDLKSAISFNKFEEIYNKLELYNIYDAQWDTTYFYNLLYENMNMNNPACDHEKIEQESEKYTGNVKFMILEKLKDEFMGGKEIIYGIGCIILEDNNDYDEAFNPEELYEIQLYNHTFESGELKFSTIKNITNEYTKKKVNYLKTKGLINDII
jgi:hypothetical protein